MPQPDYNKDYNKGKKWRLKKPRRCTDCGREAISAGGRCVVGCDGRMWVIH